MATWNNRRQEELWSAVKIALEQKGRRNVIMWLLDFIRFLMPHV